MCGEYFVNITRKTLNTWVHRMPSHRSIDTATLKIKYLQPAEITL